MIISLTVITCLCLVCITCLEIYCPPGSQTNTIVLIIGFIGPTIGQILNLYKANEIKTTSKENSQGIEQIKIATNGQTEHAINQAAALATLTEQVASAKVAALVAAKTVADTAKALAVKKEE
jgi:hypothetical protein